MKNPIHHETIAGTVDRLLNETPALQALERAARRALRSDLIEATWALASDFEARIEPVDFPAFVGTLIKGVFQAIVDASIQQMEAYAELVTDVTQSLDAFVKDNTSTDRGHLTRAHRQLLSTMVLMGINRIVVTDGEINAPVQFQVMAEQTSDPEPREGA